MPWLRLRGGPGARHKHPHTPARARSVHFCEEILNAVHVCLRLSSESRPFSPPRHKIKTFHTFSGFCQCGSEACAKFLVSEAQTASPPSFGASGAEARAGKPLVDPNRPGGTGQERPLNSASRRGRVPFVFLLLKAGADPAATDYDGETAAHAAARCGQVGAVEALAQAAAGVPSPPSPPTGEASREGERDHLPRWWFAVTDAGETATFVAAAEGHAGVLRVLRAIGALEPSRPNADGVTPMVAAALAGHSEVSVNSIKAWQQRSSRVLGLDAGTSVLQRLTQS